MNNIGYKIIRFITSAFRRYLVGAAQPWVFTPTPLEWIPPPVAQTSLYIHVPFCRNCCPYCPYTKVPYDEALVAPYTQAAIKEVDWWADHIGPAEITSVYIGGGTPTLAMNSVNNILDRVRKKFRLHGEICIETNPVDINADKVRQLRDAGVELISLGAQSFQTSYLQVLGRRYEPQDAEKALTLLAAGGFASVNVDLMFALPGQSAADLISDLDRAAQLGADQITTYPLFTFPYTSVGEYRRLAAVRMPNLRIRHAYYAAINDWCNTHDFARVSVWGFKRGAVPRYSSVTRDGYIGIGPGAGSHLPNEFVLNTFDLESWREVAAAGRSAAAVRLPFVDNTPGWWWLYWRLYDTRIPMNQLDVMMGSDAAKARRWLHLCERLGWAYRNDRYMELTETGAFWLHLVQNQFALNYVNTLWTQCQREPWPQDVAI